MTGYEIFGKTEPRIFNRTFLKDVKAKVTFTKEEEPSEQELEKFLKDNFMLEIGRNVSEAITNGLLVRSGDELVKFIFEEECAHLKMDFPAYTSFLNAGDNIQKIKKYLEARKASTTKCIEWAKYNELRFKSEEKENASNEQLLAQVFSDNLMNHWKNNEGQDRNTSRLEKEYKVQGNDQINSSITIQYGFRRDLEETGEGAITLRIIATIATETETSKMEENITTLNEIIDNAFRWCLNENIIKEMQE